MATIDISRPVLHDYITGDAVRNATEEEQQASVEAAENDGGSGVIQINGVTYYVVD